MFLSPTTKQAVPVEAVESTEHQDAKLSSKPDSIWTASDDANMLHDLVCGMFKDSIESSDDETNIDLQLQDVESESVQAWMAEQIVAFVGPQVIVWEIFAIKKFLRMESCINKGNSKLFTMYVTYSLVTGVLKIRFVKGT